MRLRNKWTNEIGIMYVSERIDGIAVEHLTGEEGHKFLKTAVYKTLEDLCEDWGDIKYGY